MARIELRDDTIYTNPMPTGAWVIGATSAGDAAPTAFGRDSIIATVQSSLAAVAMSGSATDLTTGTLPLGRLHANLQNFANIPTNTAGDILHYNGSAWTVLQPGAAGTFLRSAGAGAVPTWVTNTGTVADADYGDITVAAGAWSIDTDVISAYGRTLTVAANAAAARTVLGLVIGTDVQAYDADLATWAGLTPSANAQSLVTAASYAAMRALLDLEAGTDFYSIAAADAAFQGKDATLTALAGVTVAADKLIYATGADAFTTTDLTGFARTLLDDADALTARATLGLVIGTNVQAYDADLTTWAGLTPSANHQTLVTQTFAQMRASLDLEAGTDFYSIAATDAAIAAYAQPLAANLTSWAAITRAAGFDTFVATPSSANLAALVTGETGSGALVFGTSPSFTTDIRPASNDGASLGISGTAFSDIFLASTAVINFAAGDVTITHATNTLTFAGAASGYQFQDGLIRPVSNDGVSLGASGVAFSDLFLASGGVINWSASDVTITHAGDTLTFAGASSGGYNFNDAFVTINSANPYLRLTDNDTGSDAYITGNSTTGSLQLIADLGNEVASSTIDFLIDTNVTIKMALSATSLAPGANDGIALGTATVSWADLFLASGAVVGFNNGDVTLTHSADTLTLAGGSLVLPAAGLTVGASIPFSDSAGTLTLQNVDALDATTEATIEAAIDTLANLTSIQGRTVTLADAGANAIFGWDDTAGAYENLTAAEATATLNAFTGDSGAGGVKGLVPAPAAGDAAASKFLKADGTWVAPSGAGDVTAASTIADNRLVRGDGGAKGIQQSGITVDDSNNVTGVVALSATTIELGHASDTTLSRSAAGTLAVEGVDVAMAVAAASTSPTWKGSVSDPAIGNGTLTCYRQVIGKRVFIDLVLAIGSTTTFGSGTWFFRLGDTAARDTVGSCQLLDSGTNYRTGSCLILTGTTDIYFVIDSATNLSGQGTPITFATGDTVRLSINFPVA
jgi:hypothetical protein